MELINIMSTIRKELPQQLGETDRYVMIDEGPFVSARPYVNVTLVLIINGEKVACKHAIDPFEVDKAYSKHLQEQMLKEVARQVKYHINPNNP